MDFIKPFKAFRILYCKQPLLLQKLNLGGKIAKEKANRQVMKEERYGCKIFAATDSFQLK
jgi:hypothetical protein